MFYSIFPSDDKLIYAYTEQEKSNYHDVCLNLYLTWLAFDIHVLNFKFSDSNKPEKLYCPSLSE
jgi:hypothetical protein